MSGQLQKGERLGDYEIISVAGAGGMGVVYQATQRSLERVVALKVIRDEIASSPEYRERFLREARLAASVNHPHVVTVYDVGEQDDRLYLAMQWVDGPDLKRVLNESGRLAPERAVSITTQLAGALDALHSISGLTHRDVKPGNVLLGQVEGKDHAYLTDFGVAKPADGGDQLTRTGWTVGTTGYLSPEQIKGQDSSPRSDLYALGCLFYETLTGKPPFQGENEMAMRWAHANDARPKVSTVLPALGDRYDAFLSTALAVDPEHRFGSGREFADALTAAYRGDGTAVTTIAPVQAPPRHEPTVVGPPTPMPPPPPPRSPQPTYAPYGYVTPTPPPSQNRSGSPLALIVLGVVAVAGIAVGALAAAGVFSNGGGAETVTASRAAKRRPVPSTHAKPVAAHTESCGGDVSAGPNTTCPFAHNVEQAYLESSGGNTYVEAYSPVTRVNYTMHCTGGIPHVCTGGNDATVYFDSSPSTAPEQSTMSMPETPAALEACDQNISAGPNTSCPFAENLFVSYWEEWKEYGALPDMTVSAYSPITNRNYNMECVTDGITVDCTGGNGAFVTFPLHAVEVYKGPQG